MIKLAKVRWDVCIFSGKCTVQYTLNVIVFKQVAWIVRHAGWLVHGIDTYGNHHSSHVPGPLLLLGYVWFYMYVSNHLGTVQVILLLYTFKAGWQGHVLSCTILTVEIYVCALCGNIIQVHIFLLLYFCFDDNGNSTFHNDSVFVTQNTSSMTQRTQKTHFDGISGGVWRERVW